MKPDVTIFADASYHKKRGAAGWAAWIKADGASAVHCSAGFKTAMDTSTLAECCAVANALVVAKLRGLLFVGARVMVQSDCLTALVMLMAASAETVDRPAPGGLAVARPKKEPKLFRKSGYAPALAQIRNIVEAEKIELQTRHVRGHTRGEGRQWVNRAIDKAARRAMKENRRTNNFSKGKINDKTSQSRGASQ